MKTSNKILIGLLIVVFTVPFLLASSLKSKMKKGEYTVKKNENSNNEANLRSGSFTAFKVVKVVAPNPDFLTCHFKQSSNMSYKYYNQDSQDSIIVFSENDTLYIQYLGENVTGNGNERNMYRHFKINVDLPAFTSLVVDGAVVVLDSASAANLSVSLRNNAVIRDGTEKKEKEGVKATPPANIRNNQTLPVATAYKIKVSNAKYEVETIKEAGLEILDLDIKDLLIYSLFYRI